MGFFDFFPYTNLHNVNLDWVLQRVKEWGTKVEENNTKFENLESAYNEFTAIVTNLQSELEKLEPWLSHNAKVALLNCLRNVYYDNGNGEELYNQLAIALGGNTYPMIVVVFNLDGHNIYTDDTLETVKRYITVKYYENVTSDGIIIPPNDYELVGELNEGLDVLTVIYGDLTSLVTVNVLNWHNIHEWNYPSDIMTMYKGTFQPPTLDNDYNIRLNNADAYKNKYRVFLTEKGDSKSFIDINQVPTSFYPIPIPENSTSATIHISGNLQIRCVVVRFDEISQTYSIITSTGWSESEVTRTYAQNDNLYLIPYARTNDNVDDFTVEPSNVKITFNEE